MFKDNYVKKSAMLNFRVFETLFSRQAISGEEKEYQEKGSDYFPYTFS